MNRRLALITGASSGIGEAFAHAYARRGWDVALTARRAERLSALSEALEERYGVAAIPIVQDLAAEGAAGALLEALAFHGRAPDALVNNAGYSVKGDWLSADWAAQQQLIRVLFTVPVELMHAALPGMIGRGFGRIVNVASLVAYAPGTQGFGLYVPLKAALIKASESVHAFAAPQGVHCTALCPGLTRSEFHTANATKEATAGLPGFLWADAEPVVEAGIRAVEKGKPVCVPGLVNKALAAATRLTPEPVTRHFARRHAARVRAAQAKAGA